MKQLSVICVDNPKMNGGSTIAIVGAKTMLVQVCEVMCVLFCIFSFHRANWHSSATLTEVFPQLSGKCQGITHRDGAWPAFFPIR